MDLTSKGGDSLVGEDYNAVGKGTREVSDVDMVLLLEVMEDLGR